MSQLSSTSTCSTIYSTISAFEEEGEEEDEGWVLVSPSECFPRPSSSSSLSSFEKLELSVSAYLPPPVYPRSLELELEGHGEDKNGEDGNSLKDVEAVENKEDQGGIASTPASPSPTVDIEDRFSGFLPITDEDKEVLDSEVVDKDKDGRKQEDVSPTSPSLASSTSSCSLDALDLDFEALSVSTFLKVGGVSSTSKLDEKISDKKLDFGTVEREVHRTGNSLEEEQEQSQPQLHIERGSPLSPPSPASPLPLPPSSPEPESTGFFFEEEGKEECLSSGPIRIWSEEQEDDKDSTFSFPSTPTLSPDRSESLISPPRTRSRVRHENAEGETSSSSFSFSSSTLSADSPTDPTSKGERVRYFSPLRTRSQTKKLNGIGICTGKSKSVGRGKNGRKLSTGSEKDDKAEQRQCMGLDCINAARKTSKYCSQTCCIQLAVARIQHHLPERYEQWSQVPCVADIKNKQRIREIEKEMEIVMKHIEAAEDARQNLENHIKRVEKMPVEKGDKDECYQTSHRDKEAEEYGAIDCVSCGRELPAGMKGQLKHMEACFNKLESQRDFASTLGRLNVAIPIFCDAFDKKDGTYCKKFHTLCPRHYRNKVGAGQICGFPNTADFSTVSAILQNLQKDGICQVPKLRCGKHHNWDRIQRGSIDAERWRVWLKWDELTMEKHFLEKKLKERGNLLALLLHQTTAHEPNNPPSQVKKYLEALEDDTTIIID